MNRRSFLFALPVLPVLAKHAGIKKFEWDKTRIDSLEPWTYPSNHVAYEELDKLVELVQIDKLNGIPYHINPTGQWFGLER